MNVTDLNNSQENLVQQNNYENCLIEKVDNTIQYSDFFEKFMVKNMPCVIKNVAADWESTSKWIDNNTINYNHFILEYGDLEAPVADCGSMVFNVHSKINMTVSEYMHYLQNKNDKILYLKDWHLKKIKPTDDFYNVPILFASDWLNEYAEDQHDDDYMFVYIGPKDSWTPLHADVFSSYSWSVNVIGKKKWILFPPGEESKLKDRFGNLPMQFHEDVFNAVKYFEIVQEKGDAVFVPSGWHHQVINVLDTISINHNWINGCNIERVWQALQYDLGAVENEIKEFKNTEDFESHCQLMLKSMFGMDFKMFIQFIYHISKKRIEQLHSNTHIKFGKATLGMKHIKFDLRVLSNMVSIICEHHLFNNQNVIPLPLKNDFLTLKHTITSITL